MNAKTFRLCTKIFNTAKASPWFFAFQLLLPTLYQNVMLWLCHSTPRPVEFCLRAGTLKPVEVAVLEKNRSAPYGPVCVGHERY